MKLLSHLGLLAVGGVIAVSSYLRVPTERVAVASVDTVDVSPNLDTLFGKQPVALSARVVDSAGRVKHAKVTWTVRDTTLFRSRKTYGSNDTAFVAYAKGDSGRTYIVAAAGSKKDSALVIVRDTVCSATTLSSLDFGTDSITMHRTDTVGLTVVPRSQCGGYLNGVNPTFSSSTAGVATATRVDSLFVKVISLDSTGTTYIKAVSGSVRDSVKVKAKHAP